MLVRRSHHRRQMLRSCGLADQGRFRVSIGGRVGRAPLGRLLLTPLAVVVMVVRKVVVLALRRLELVHWPLTRLPQLAASTWCCLMWWVGSLRRMIGLALSYEWKRGG